MSGAGLFQLIALLVVLAVTAPPLGRYMAAVYGARADGSGARRPVLPAGRARDLPRPAGGPRA